MSPADTAALAVLMNGLAPVLACLIAFGIPAVIVYTVKHFKLRHRELELEAELHGKQSQARLAAIEARLGTLETVLGAIARLPAASSLPQDRLSLLEPPPAASEEPAELPTPGVRSR
jgi:hypothetical protein